MPDSECSDGFKLAVPTLNDSAVKLRTPLQPIMYVYLFTIVIVTASSLVIGALGFWLLGSN